MSLCSSIDTLAMAYLDDELAPEERRELELHLVDCPSCRTQVDGERAELDMLRKALVAPPAPDLVKAKITRLLDDEDDRASRDDRRRLSRWLLPGSAVAAAAAALLVFVGVGLGPRGGGPPRAASEVVRQQTRPLPLEVQGASTGPWLREHFAPVEPPQFPEPGIQMDGARATVVDGHDAAVIRYLVTLDNERVALNAFLLKNLRGDELSAGQEIQVGGLTLHVFETDGQPFVSYVDADHVGYYFTSSRLTASELLQLVVTSDLIGRAQQQIR